MDNNNPYAAPFGLGPDYYSDAVNTGTGTTFRSDVEGAIGNQLFGIHLGDRKQLTPERKQELLKTGVNIDYINRPQLLQLGFLDSNSALEKASSQLPQLFAASQAKKDAFNLSNYQAGLQNYYADKQFERQASFQNQILDKQLGAQKSMFNRQAAYNIATSGSTYKNLAGMV
jgi:hypothetical protein